MKEERFKQRGNDFKRKEIVTNLSSRKLTEAEISLLAKRFSFVPTRKSIDIAKVQSDLVEWERRMILREHFYDKEDETTEEDKKTIGEKRK